MPSVRRAVLVLLFPALLLTACSSGSSSTTASGTTGTGQPPTTTAAGPTASGTSPGAGPTPTSPAALPKAATVAGGSCTLVSRTEAANLLKASINSSSAAPIGTVSGGQRIDLCSYGNVNASARSEVGFSYGVYRFASAAAAQAGVSTVVSRLYAGSLGAPVPFAVPGVPDSAGLIIRSAVWIRKSGPYVDSAAAAATTVGDYAIWVCAVSPDGNQNAENLDGAVFTALVHSAS